MFIIVKGENTSPEVIETLCGYIKLNDIEKAIWKNCRKYSLIEDIFDLIDEQKDKEQFNNVLKDLQNKKILYVANSRKELINFMKKIKIEKSAIPGIGKFNRNVHFKKDKDITVRLTKIEYEYYKYLNLDMLKEEDYIKIYDLSKKELFTFNW